MDESSSKLNKITVANLKIFVIFTNLKESKETIISKYFHYSLCIFRPIILALYT